MAAKVTRFFSDFFDPPLFVGRPYYRALGIGHTRSIHKRAGSTVHTINCYESLSWVWLVTTQYEFAINNKKKIIP